MADRNARSGAFGVFRAIGDFAGSLAGRLLALTIAALIIGEILVLGPALARYHEQWLRERMNLAQVAALALEGSPDYEMAESLEFELLTNAEVQRAALQRAGERVLLLEDPNAAQTVPQAVYDYTRAENARPLLWAMQTLFAPPNRIVQAMARPRFESGEYIEIVLNEAPLKRAMEEYARSFLFGSALILLAAAMVIYWVLTFVFVRPMHELTEAIERFRDKPEDVSIAFPRSSRRDEIGRAQRAAADMAEQVRNALRQNERLAALGGAVARIGHDLRNMLSTAQLVADRLSQSEDPDVRRLLPRLERTIARAAGLATGTLKYGRVDEKAPDLDRVDVLAAVEEAAGDVLPGFAFVTLRLDIEAKLACVADPEHLQRILGNLIRNAAQAMKEHTRADKTLVIRAARVEGRCEIELIDHGPGVRQNIRGRLFEPFVSAAPEAGGAGLGLAIARELTRAMGGELELTRTGAEGTTFKITLPAA
ncbi:MAG: HAMP domain-containing histidine kinase [Hyphomonadaceae bacterium]|nr:HAMP domain-containing histidine kinase [Hyphomonadaceae bacterium]